MQKQVILSLEQALALPYCTQRFVQLGWRVIRIESTPQQGQPNPGDPNRYVGDLVDSDDRRAYFIAPNVGKQSITIDLKRPEGQQLLHNLIRKLPVDVFLSNTLPKRYESLGISYETLRGVKDDLIWVGISALGPDYPDVPGYDPALQAMLGWMDLTGEKDGPPMLCGIPVVDLKVGDEAFAQVCLALAERATTGMGKKIEISMAQAAASWLITVLPLLDMGSSPEDVRRSGNEHKQFIPTNVYLASDGYVYLAIGNDLQWERLVAIPAFSSLRKEGRETNEGRRNQKDAIRTEISAIVKCFAADEIVETLTRAGLVASRVHTVSEVRDLPFIARKLLSTRRTNGALVRLPPPAVDLPFIETIERDLPFPPRYGRHNDVVFREVGLDATEIARLRAEGIIT